LNAVVQDEDPLITTHLSDMFLCIDKNKEAILILADKIKEYPYLVPLLLKQAQAFIKSEYFEYALKLSKICVDLCPESFEAWFQLAEVYFHMKKIKMVGYHEYLFSLEFDCLGLGSSLRGRGVRAEAKDGAGVRNHQAQDQEDLGLAPLLDGGSFQSRFQETSKQGKAA
jgi:tetratricopeptide (TPR) repeat protein